MSELIHAASALRVRKELTYYDVPTTDASVKSTNYVELSPAQNLTVPNDMYSFALPGTKQFTN